MPVASDLILHLSSLSSPSSASNSRIASVPSDPVTVRVFATDAVPEHSKLLLHDKLLVAETFPCTNIP